jgi:hypothetical protein
MSSLTGEKSGIQRSIQCVTLAHPSEEKGEKDDARGTPVLTEWLHAACSPQPVYKRNGRRSPLSLYE